FEHLAVTFCLCFYSNVTLFDFLSFSMPYRIAMTSAGQERFFKVRAYEEKWRVAAVADGCGGSYIFQFGHGASPG
ncbi:hypothetical protein, partial [Halomonas sp. PR-M31]|uniref:hypothetical protein n=1 Tax=Halomonas sp. PR-M31 TaxID=1471202 RepID=UPI001C11BA17